MNIRSTIAVGALAVTLAACGGTSAAGSADPTQAPTATSTQTGTADATAKLHANTATQAEIATALAAAGVPNADRWAREVTEYRPYDTGDPNMTQLRTELAKYNPADGVVDLIVSVLQP